MGQTLTQYFDITLQMVDLVETSLLSWTDSVSVIISYQTLYIQTFQHVAYHIWHVSLYFSVTMFVDTQHWELHYRV
jgi:hypothetical protein